MLIAHYSVSLAIAAAVTTAACNTDSSSASLTLSPNSATLSAGGGTTTFIASVMRDLEATGSVSITLTGLPAGTTYTVTDLATAGEITSGTVTIATTAGTPLGVSTITVRASGATISDATAPFTLTIGGNYTLSLSTSQLSIPAGSSGSVDISIDRQGFDGAVTLSTDATAAGTTTFSPVSTTGASSNLMIAVPTSASTATYTVTVRGTASGLPDQTTTLTVTITNAVP